MDQVRLTLSLYGLLNAEAKQWWYHAQLRKSERANEARRLERISVRSMLGALRATSKHNGYLLILDQESASDPRWMLYLSRYQWWSGYCANTSRFVHALKLCGVPAFYYTELNGNTEQLHARLQG